MSRRAAAVVLIEGYMSQGAVSYSMIGINS